MIKKCLLPLSIVFIASFCYGQTDSIVSTENKVESSSSILYSNFPSFRFYLNTAFYTSDSDLPPNLVLSNKNKCNYPYFSSPIYYSAAYKRNFSNRFSEKYDPANPWGASHPIEGIASGSINYLLRAIDKKTLYKR